MNYDLQLNYSISCALILQTGTRIREYIYHRRSERTTVGNASTVVFPAYNAKRDVGDRTSHPTCDAEGEGFLRISNMARSSSHYLLQRQTTTS